VRRREKGSKVTNRAVILVGAALALLTTTAAVRMGLWNHPLGMDNRLYFYLAERAASGIAPHVSTPDVKTQLSTLADAASISVGRTVGLDDVHAGRLGALAILITGIWGVGLSVRALGASGGAATAAALSVLTFSDLLGHVVVGFNPKIMLFAVLAWGPWLLARGHFAWGGAAACAAMLCWQPAAAACLATALGALAAPRPVRALASVTAGGFAVFALYEMYYVWHGALAAQLFQNWVLPLGSVHEAENLIRRSRYVIFGGRRGIDSLGIPAISFILFVLIGIVRLTRTQGSLASRMPAPAVVLILVAGSLMALFTSYERQAEPDRFLLVAYFAIAFGVVVDSALRYVRMHVHERSAYQLEGALAVLLLLFVPRGEYPEGKPSKRLEGQIERASIVAMAAEAYGSVWSYGCYHLMGLAHLANHHPLDHIWDDLRVYFDESTFAPVAHGRLPDVILECSHLPGRAGLLEEYTTIALPDLAGQTQLHVRTSALAASAADGTLDMPMRIPDERDGDGRERHREGHRRQRRH
jgi:hypothetical protein